jgi:uncharacterized protein (DUF2147 family)
MKPLSLIFQRVFSFLLTLSLLGGSTVFAQTEGNAIEGYWLTDNKKAKFHIFKTASGSFAGRLIWMRSPNDKDGKPKMDTKNPNEKLRGRLLQDAIMITGLKWDTDDQEFKGGKVYDPTSGKTYNCFAKLDGQELKLRGYVGVSLLGKTTVWTRASN